MLTHSFKVDKYVSLVAVSVPFLGYYGYGFLSFAFINICLLYLYVYIKTGRIHFSNAKFFYCYILYYFISRAILGTSFGDKIAPSVLFFFVYWCFLNEYLKLSSFLKFYRIAAFINIVFFVVQELMYAIIGYRIFGIVSFLPSTLGNGEIDMNSFAEKYSEAERSCAFFSEPAHFVQFLLPLLAIELLYVANRKAYFRCVLYVLTLLGLASGNALLGLFVVFLFYIVSLWKKMRSVLSIICVFFVVAVTLSFVVYIMQTEYGKKLMDRQEQLDPEPLHSSSGFIRIFRGYYVLDTMPSASKIFGLNSDDKLDDAIEACDVSTTFKEGDRYLNGVQKILVYTGYIGTILFIIGLSQIYRGNNLAGKCCIAIFVSLSFIASIFFSYTMVFMLVCSSLMLKEKQGILS